MRAGDRDRAQAVHQPGECVRAVDDRDAELGRAGELRVVRADRGGDHDTGGVGGEVAGGVPDVDRGAQRAQRLGGGGLLRVAARHLGSTLREDLRDARHPGAADADEVRSVHRGRKAGCHACISPRSGTKVGAFSRRERGPSLLGAADSASQGTPADGPGRPGTRSRAALFCPRNRKPTHAGPRNRKPAHAGPRNRDPAHALLCENSFRTGTPTLWRAREAQSRWKNSST